MQRRQLLHLAAGGIAALSLPVIAQTDKRARRIGFIAGGTLQSNAARLTAFRAGMLELRWVEARDYAIDARFTSGATQAGASMAAELVASAPDLLLCTGDAVARLLVERTKTIPIVFAIVQDPVGSGLAASLQRPGGNVTGVTSLGRDLSGKRLQLLKEAFPRVAHVVSLFEPDNAGSVSSEKEIEEAAPRLGMRVTPIGLRQAADTELAFKRGASLGAHAYILTQGGFINTQHRAIADRIIRLKVPSIGALTEYVETGGLMSYSASHEDNFRRTAAYVDKILKGAKPGDLPVEQPTKFELVVNQKTAKAMGVTFPQSFLLQVDRVIE